MSMTNAIPRGMVNSVGEARFGNSRSMLRSIDAVMRVAQALWPRKTAAQLAVRAGVSQRACEYWLARKSDLSADALTRLLRSDEGLDFLEAIMADARPEWWRDFKRRTQLGALRREIEERRKTLERLEMAE